MVVRHQKIDFAAGALVFPGGKMAAGDHDPRVLARCSGVDGLSAEQVVLRVGAIREAFEECGVLLARRMGQSGLLNSDELVPLGARYRRPLDAGEIRIAEMLEAEDLQLACEALVPFAHWITPKFMPKRFDTHFYVVATPAEQHALHDGREAVDSVWIRPADAMAQAQTGERTLVPATLLNVEKLGEAKSCADAIKSATCSNVVCVEPEFEFGDGLVHMKIPADAGYRITEFSMPMGKA